MIARRERVSIWAGTLALSIVYVTLVAATWAFLIRARVAGLAMEIAVAVAMVQGSVIVVILAGTTLRRGLARKRAVRSAQIRAAVDAIAASAAVGEDPLPRAQALMRVSPRDTIAHLESAAHAVRGDTRERLEAAIRALGGYAPPEALPRSLRALAAAPLLDRALAADALAPEAARLAETEIAEAIASGAPDVILAGLDLVRAWRRLVVLAGAAGLVRHADPRVREAACDVLPYVIPPEGVDLVPLAVQDALRDPAPRVRAAAARAAGALRMTEAEETLDALVADPDPAVSLAAAFALAALPDGARALTRHSTATTRVAAAHAFEALEKRNLGRLEAL